MNPVLPEKLDQELEELCWSVSSESAELGRGIAAGTLDSIAEFLQILNSFYTNSMEGNPSRLRDIEAALHKSFQKDPELRNYQLEHVAHINTQKKMLARLSEDASLEICSPEFIRWLHEEFYNELPVDLRFALTLSGAKIPVVPGQLRDQAVVVGAHEASPEGVQDIANYLQVFSAAYRPESLSQQKQQLVALAASHHRLLWIHPFPDGNGRVARLFTTAYMNKIGLASNNLWTINRFFARNRREYDAHLERADRPPRNSLDGRGPLSEEDLVDFCKYFLKGCLDQIRFMKKSLSPIHFLKPKFQTFLLVKAQQREISKMEALALTAIFAQGEISRGEIQKVCGVKSRRATEIIRNLLKSDWVRSESAYGSLTLKITSEMIPFLFPDLV